MNARPEVEDKILSPQPGNSNLLIKNKLLADLTSSVAAGTTVAYTFFPFEAYKKYLQSGQTGKFYPYRGSLIFATNIVPTTTIHLTTNGYLQSYMQKDASNFQKLGASFYCGVQGAVFATVVENCILKQQIQKIKPITALKEMFNYSPLRPWKSYPMIATRDGIFTAYMLWAGRESDEYTTKHFSPAMSYLTNFSIGALGTAISHPFDAIATHMQGTDNKKTVKQAAKEIFAEKGYQGFYRGFLPRLCMFYAFGNVIPLVKNQIDQYIADPGKKTAEVKNYFSPVSEKNEKKATAADQPNVDYVDLRVFKK